MTSAKSSLNPFLFTYRRTLVRFAGAATGMMFPLFVFFGSVFGEISSYNSLIKAGAFDKAKALREAMQFIFVSDSTFSEVGIGSVAQSIILFIIGAALAFFAFGFMLLRPSVNVQYSLGISRSDLFFSKYLAGATAGAIGVVFPFLVLTLFNAWFYGSSAALWITFAYLSLSFFAVFMYAFTIVALVITLVGSFFEAGVMGAICIVAPALICKAFSVFLTVMAYGSPSAYLSVNGHFVTFSDLNGNYVTQPSREIFSAADYLMPCRNYSELFLVRGDTFARPKILPALIFIAVIALIAAGAAAIHSRRKAETAGALGASPAIEGWCVFTVGSYLASLVASIFYFSTLSLRTVKILTVVAGIVIMAVGYTVAELSFLRSFRSYRKRLWHLLLPVTAFLVLIFFTGVIMNGAYKRIPAKSEIASASVSLPYPSDFTTKSYYSGEEFDLEALLSETAGERTVFGEFTSEEDIDKILELNGIIKNGKSGRGVYSFCFSYTLKNGRQVKRIYRDAGKEALKKSAELMKGSIYRDGVKKILEKNSTNEFVLFSPNMSSMNGPLVINEKQESRDAFRECIIKDLEAGYFVPGYQSDEEVLGYIGMSGYYSTASNEIYYDPSEYNAEIDVDFFEESFIFDFADYRIFPIYPGMKNTLDYLEKTGCMKYLENREEYVKISWYIPVKEGERSDQSTGLLSARGLPKDYESNITYADGTYESFRPVMPADSKVITDPAQIADFTKRIRGAAYNTDNGAFVKADFASGDYVLAYIPENLLPG